VLCCVVSVTQLILGPACRRRSILDNNLVIHSHRLVSHQDLTIPFESSCSSSRCWLSCLFIPPTISVTVWSLFVSTKISTPVGHVGCFFESGLFMVTKLSDIIIVIIENVVGEAKHHHAGSEMLERKSKIDSS
jgi:hypothetical protein